MQDELIEVCRRWIKNYQDANHAKETIHQKFQLGLLSDSYDELIAFRNSVDWEREFENKVKPYLEQSALINSEIEAKLANVSAEIRMHVRAWREQNWHSRYSSWGQLFAILAEDGIPVEIPVEHRSKPITKKKAAKLLGRSGNEGRAVEWLNNCINEGTISCMEMSRQSFCFDIRQFPKDKHQQLSP